MLFNSLEFIVFFILVTALYFFTPQKFKWVLLLLASSLFYMYFKASYVLILYFTILIDYAAGLAIERSVHKKARQAFLVISLAANLGVLAFFKYYNFMVFNISGLGSWAGLDHHLPLLDILLPIGLSFHTFQAISYLIEVYRGKQKTEKHLGIFAVYVMFYPQLVAGPIERPQHMLPQFCQPHRFNLPRVTSGLKLMLWGFFKKVVIADNLAIMVNQVYDHPQQFQGLPLLAATMAFAFQIYCDFSGYSDIALGCARVMGFSLMTNFKFPYLSETVAEFWRRWHISLSSWFRDYVYIPLGGNRQGLFVTCRNLLVVFTLCGIWHGANWNFVVWGLLHGCYLVLGLFIKPIGQSLMQATAFHFNPKLVRTFNICLTFLAVCFAWIFFRAASLTDAFYIISHLFSGIPGQVKGILTPSYFPINKAMGKMALLLFAALFLFKEKELIQILEANARPRWFRWSAYYLLFILIFLFANQRTNQFIYFQF
jgi:alginate O-acetyltransferase complex protein AlgI